MRQIVYDNIIELIKNNDSVCETTNTGIKYTLYGHRKNVVLSTYSNNRKIELFIGEKLFASANKSVTRFSDQSADVQQLYNIERALNGMPLHYIDGAIRVVKHHHGATPQQTRLLQNAWWKSRSVNRAMCSALGNQR